MYQLVLTILAHLNFKFTKTFFRKSLHHMLE